MVTFSITTLPVNTLALRPVATKVTDEIFKASGSGLLSFFADRVSKKGSSMEEDGTISQNDWRIGGNGTQFF